MSEVEDPYYAGGNVSFVNYSEDLIQDDASLTSIYGRYGYQFHDNFSAELRFGKGIGDDTLSILGTNVDVSLNNFFGGYVRGGIPAGEYFYPYLVIGYTRGKLDVVVSGFADSGSESDVSYGIGTDIMLSKNWGANIEYMNYLDKDEAEISGFAIGIITKF